MHFTFKMLRVIKLTFISAALLLTVFFFISQVNMASAAPTNVAIITNVPAPAYPVDNVTYATYFSSPLLDKSNFSQLFSLYTQTFNSSAVDITTFDQTIDSRVYLQFGPQNNFTQQNVNFLRTALVSNGESLLYIIGANNGTASLVANNFFDQFFSQNILTVNNNTVQGNSINGPTPYTAVSNFVSPSSPIFNNVTQLYFNGTTIALNETSINQLLTNKSLNIKDIYPIMFNSYDQKYLAIAIEFKSNGRLVLLGSLDMLTNDKILPISPNNPVQGQQNAAFAVNLLKWLGRASGYSQLMSDTVNLTDNRPVIYPGTKINITLRLENDANQSFRDAVIRLSLVTAETEFVTTYATYIGNGTYTGIIDTKYAPRQQSYDVEAIVQRRGYMEQQFVLLSQVFVSPFPPSNSLPDILMSMTLIATVVIFIVIAGLSWVNYRKIA